MTWLFVAIPLMVLAVAVAAVPLAYMTFRHEALERNARYAGVGRLPKQAAPVARVMPTTAFTAPPPPPTPYTLEDRS